MANGLTKEEINNRLIKLRNFERLYPELKNRYERIKTKNKQQQSEIQELHALVESQASLIQKLQLRIEELEIKVFGKRKKHNSNDDYGSIDHTKQGDKREQRPPSSFRRQKPKDEDITETKHFHIGKCPDCKGTLTKIKKAIRYIEDMILPTEVLNVFKKVEKQIITTGYCKHCKRRVSAVPIPKHEVVLGESIKRFVTYSNVILRLSYDQTRSLLKDLASINISEGEITNILDEQSRILYPEFEQLKERIRGQPGAHYDESSWNVQKEQQGKYVWVKTGTDSTDTVFLFGRSRGKGNAEELKDNNDQVGISDDYGAYRTLFKYHQLCWAHPKRKLRDLKNSECLDEATKQHCENVYQAFSILYEQLRKELAKDFELASRKKLRIQLLKEFDKIATPHPLDPAKLKTTKESLRKNKDSYFTCLMIPGIPSDNNKAERALRHVVLKRKSSFGSKTQKGADTISVLYSVLLSLWWKRPDHFFAEYASLARGGE